VTREIIVAGALGAALLTAALVRPPRAAPAFSPAVMASEAPDRRVMVSGAPRRRVMVSGAPRRGAESNHDRHRPRGHTPRGYQKRSTRRHPKSHIQLVVDLNHADARELARVPGITPDLARRIVAYRAVVGPFATLDDLSDLDGLSEGRLISLGRYLVVR